MDTHKRRVKFAESNLSNTKRRGLLFQPLRVILFQRMRKEGSYVARAHKMRFCGMTVLIGTRIFGMFDMFGMFGVGQALLGQFLCVRLFVAGAL